jgi:outer membrane immunogenic protein
MKKLMLAAAAAVLAMGSYAGAADLPVARRAVPPPVAPVASWTGCYVGIGGGYGVADIRQSVTSPTTGAAFDIGHDNGARGYLATVGVGCDYQVASSFTIGILADFDWTGLRGDLSYNCPGGCAGPTGFVGEARQRGAWYVGGRLGYVVNPQLLGFVSGGWTQIRFGDTTLGDASGLTATAVTVPAQTYSGWWLGGGAEYALGFWSGLFWKSEYRFADYGARDTTAVCSVGPGCAVGTAHAIVRTHPYVQTVRSELVWRFNWGGAVAARY